MSNSADGRSVTSKLGAILRTFSVGTMHSLSDIARSAGLPISTAHRLTAELVELGFLERTEGKQFRVGVLVGQIDNGDAAVPGLDECARPVMADLCSVARSPVRLGILDGVAVSYIERSPHSGIAPAALYDRHLPVHATAMGKALLAFSAPQTVALVLARGLRPFTPFTVVDGPTLRRELAVVRCSQVAISRQELLLNTAALAVPVFVGGRVVAAIEVVGNSVQQLLLLKPVMVVAARGLSREWATHERLRQVTGHGVRPAWAETPIATGRKVSPSASGPDPHTEPVAVGRFG